MLLLTLGMRTCGVDRVRGFSSEFQKAITVPDTWDVATDQSCLY